jgi:hypothetical protein
VTVPFGPLGIFYDVTLPDGTTERYVPGGINSEAAAAAGRFGPLGPLQIRDGDFTIHAAGRTNRGRPRSPEVEERRRAIAELAEAEHPCSVRNVYYRAVVAGIVTKDQRGYDLVQRDLADLRRRRLVPWEWIVDHTRLVRKPTTYRSVEEALRRTAEHYRRDLWADSPVRLEVWAESQSIASVVADVADEWAVPLMATKGYSSLSFAWAAAQAANREGRPLVVLYIGDHDPDGLNIEAALRDRLVDHLAVPLTMTRIGVTWDQVVDLDLPGGAPKRDYGYPLAVEAEALPASTLRRLLHEAIADHADEDRIAVLLEAEQSERELMRRIGGAR